LPFSWLFGVQSLFLVSSRPPFQHIAIFLNIPQVIAPAFATHSYLGTAAHSARSLHQLYMLFLSIPVLHYTVRTNALTNLREIMLSLSFPRACYGEMCDKEW
jgi:hypothetical protein